MKYNRCTAILLSLGAAMTLALFGAQTDVRLKSAFRRPLQNGWIYVHLEGTPAEIGYQHGYLLAPEIADGWRVIAAEIRHDTSRDWKFFRSAAEKALWPVIEQEYREELKGIAAGVQAKGVKLDLWDIVAANAWLELPGYAAWYSKEHPASAWQRRIPVAERCSAFVAAGSYTKDGRPVIGHNAWTYYGDGQRWNIIFDIVPSRGHRILMDGFPGIIHSGDDFGINSAGIMITETTITGFSGWKADAIPEFVRARKAMQYSASIDDFARIMKEGNNGGYANNWLVADNNTNEVASLELGLKHVNLWRKKDGYFVGSNFPVDERLAKEETNFDVKDLSLSANARRVRWEQLMAEYKGRIDVAAGQRFLSDHYDSYARRESPNERTLCGHIEFSERGVGDWQPPFGVAGAVQAKVSDAAMAGRMSFTAAMGHSCGMTFKAAEHLARHPEFNWMKPFLGDLESHPWTTFSVSGK